MKGSKDLIRGPGGGNVRFDHTELQALRQVGWFFPAHVGQKIHLPHTGHHSLVLRTRSMTLN